MMGTMFSPGMSATVAIPTTPGVDSTPDRSRRTTRAWGRSERIVFTWTIPENTRSSA